MFTINNQTVDEAAGTMTLTVSLSNPVDIPVTVDVGYTDLTTEPDDFDHTTDAVTFVRGGLCGSGRPAGSMKY